MADVRTMCRWSATWLLVAMSCALAAPLPDEAVSATTPPDAPPRRTAAEYLALLPDPVATYSGKQLSAAEATRALLPRLRMLLSSEFVPSQREFLDLARQWVTELVDRELLLAEAAAAGITPELDQVQAQLAQVKSQLGADNFANGLVQEGISEAELAQTMAAEMALRKWLEQEVQPHVQVTPGAVQAYYDTHQGEFTTPAMVEISHLLAIVQADADAEQRAAAHAQATAWRQQIAAGAAFAQVARDHSQCPSGKQAGGRLGPFGRGQFGREFASFEQAVFALEPGQISAVLESPLGYHVVQAGASSPAKLRPLASIADELQQQLQQAELARRLEALLVPLRAAAELTVLVGES